MLAGTDEYYREVRERFNDNPNSYDFIFLNRACFNGMIRFNSKGRFNVPFCKKPNRFSPAYITKIVNQVRNVQELIQSKDYSFTLCSFENSIKSATSDDFIYCDPPYIDRYSDYFNSWSEQDESELFVLLKKTEAKFILSTWYGNKYRNNQYIDKYWSNFNVVQKEHFYHLGASEKNRNKMIEALIFNYKKSNLVEIKSFLEESDIAQLSLVK